jgi:diadenosine tetraphosphate (Ap4A) HIT family hydrolase
MYKLDNTLAKDTLVIGQFSLCDVLLMNDARYPWVILVPQRQQISEVYQLFADEQQQLAIESSFVAQQLAQMVGADKMNIAALGNVVSQLHIHHVARFIGDETWPAPVWGKGSAVAYNEQECELVIKGLQAQFVALLQHGD